MVRLHYRKKLSSCKKVADVNGFDQTAQTGNQPKRHRRRMMGRGPSYYAQGEPMVWLTGGSLALCFVMIVVMLLGVFYMGSSTFWPLEIQQVKTMRGECLAWVNKPVSSVLNPMKIFIMV